MHTLSHKVAIISGGTGYVGSAVAKQLAKVGMRVALVYAHAKREDVDHVLAELSGEGHRAYQCNVTNEIDVAACVDKVEREMGNIYACVHAAGLKPVRKALLATTTEEMEEQLRVNVMGSFHFLTACARCLKAHSAGMLIGITTAGVVIPEAARSLGGYTPAKYAVQGMLTMLKDECAKYGVRVYSVAPGFMAGGMNADIPQAFVEMVRVRSSEKILTTADDVAEKIAFLCTDEKGCEHDLTMLVAREYRAQ